MEENKKQFSTVLANASDAYLPLIERQLEGHSIKFNEYSKRCVLNAIAAINQCITNAGISWNDKSLDQSNLTQVLLNVASLELNPSAEPAECYFQIRNVKRKVEGGKDEYKKVIEFNIQGDGYDAILARFGRGVKKVYPFWVVRENDYFEYPQYDGLQCTPPKWSPTGGGNVVRIVYPVLFDDNTIQFYIGEKEEVKKNLLAHINNNLMNETFGIAESRYKATPDQLAKINKKKDDLKRKAKTIGFGALDDEELAPYISPSWKEDFSRESMIIRKMRNNVVRKIPKDFGNSAIMESYSEATSEEYTATKNAIASDTAIIEVEPIAPPDGADERKSGDENGGREKVAPNANDPTGANFEPQSGDVENRVKPNFG